MGFPNRLITALRCRAD